MKEQKADDLAKFLNYQIEVEFEALQRTLDLNAEDASMAIHQIIHLMGQKITDQAFGETTHESR